MTISTGSLVEDVAQRIGYFGLGAWLGELGAWIGRPQPFPPRLAPREFLVTQGNGLAVTLYAPSWKAQAEVLPDTWVFYEATLAQDLPLPFGLVAETETPDSAQAKLSDDVSWGKPAADGTSSVTFFLKDFRVVVVAFHRSRVGIASVTLTRLFAWPDWRRRIVNP